MSQNAKSLARAKSSFSEAFSKEAKKSGSGLPLANLQLSLVAEKLKDLPSAQGHALQELRLVKASSSGGGGVSAEAMSNALYQLGLVDTMMMQEQQQQQKKKGPPPRSPHVAKALHVCPSNPFFADSLFASLSTKQKQQPRGNRK